jgi:hypothetical protein
MGIETETKDTPVKRKGASPSTVTRQRLTLRESGYVPIPCEGKIPPMKEWQKRTDATPEEIERWEQDGWFPNARNTGILTKTTPTIDIDILDPAAAEAAENLVRDKLEGRGVILVRFGQSPKRAIPLRTDVPFKKINAPLTAPGGNTDQKIELLADGQQVVVYGTHPGTGQQYSWHGGSPQTVKREDLPHITEKEAHELVNDIVQMLVNDFGYTAKPLANGKNGRVHPKQLEENIKNGEALHDSLRDLAIKELARGRPPADVIAHLQKQMEKTPEAKRDQRWHERYDEIPRSVDGGVTWLEAERAKTADSLDKLLEEMNAKYAVVKVGGKTRVMEFEPDPIYPRCKVPVFQTLPDFRAFHHKNKIMVVDEKGKPKLIGHGQWWLDNAERRQYDSVVYSPGKDLGPDVCNLWQGFACEAREGDCSLYLEHMLNNVCRGNEEHYQYLLRKLAYGVQHPGRRGEVAVVLRGKEGTGKGMFVRIYGSLFGPHFKHISHPRHLTGHFNSLQQDCSVLFGDEVFFAGDRTHEGILKALITEPTLQIERKGIDTITARNMMHIFLSSNSAWMIPAGADARRFFVLDVGDAQKQNNKFFAALQDQMMRGGREALLHMLLNLDIADFQVQVVPQTPALADQKQRSRRGVDALVEHMAFEGQLLETHDLYADVAVVTERGGRGFFKAAQSVAPDLRHLHWIVVQRTLKEEWGCTPWHSGNLRGLQFPPLRELRARFDARHGPQAWEDPDADWRFVGEAVENPGD